MVITSRKNPVISELRALCREKKARDAKGEFLIEGAKLAQEAVKSGLEITGAYAAAEALEKYPDTADLLKKQGEITVINAELAEYISDQKTPQGIFVTAKILDKSRIWDKIKEYSRVILLDRLQDSGNVGTIIRTAEAMGFDAVLANDGTADLWSPKVIRSAMGSLFRLPCCQIPLAELIPELIGSGFDVYGALLDEQAQRLEKISFGSRNAVVIGNEGNGISAEIAALCNKKVYIPIKNAESLNAAAAAAILCWELRADC